jgi:hypothetical protein
LAPFDYAKGFVMRFRGAGTLIVLIVLAVTGTALAASGVSSVVFGDSASAKSSQEPLGRVSASPAPKANNNSPAATNDQGSDGIVLGAQAQRKAAGGNAGGGARGGRLPFTGLMAIPVIALGFALLGAGLVLRRRTVRTLT